MLLRCTGNEKNSFISVFLRFVFSVVYMSLHIRMSAGAYGGQQRASGAYGGQQRASGALDLELQAVRNHPVGR